MVIPMLSTSEEGEDVPWEQEEDSVSSTWVGPVFIQAGTYLIFVLEISVCLDLFLIVLGQWGSLWWS